MDARGTLVHWGEWMEAIRGLKWQWGTYNHAEREKLGLFATPPTYA